MPRPRTAAGSASGPREQASTGGGHVWRYSGDLKLNEGDGKTTGTSLVWVQPPGTPTAGMAFLEAYTASQDEYHPTAACDARVEEGVMDAHDPKPDPGVISSATFARNVTWLARFIAGRYVPLASSSGMQLTRFARLVYSLPARGWKCHPAGPSGRITRATGASNYRTTLPD